MTGEAIKSGTILSAAASRRAAGARLARIAAALIGAAALAGCGGGGGAPAGAASGGSVGSRLAGLLSFGPPPATHARLDPNAPQLRTCPEVLIFDGGASRRVGGPSSASVRHQFAIKDVARECQLQGQTLAIKVGVAGDLLLGPAGSGGTYSANVRVSVRSEKTLQTLATRSYRVSASVRGSESAVFELVTDTFTVPFVSEYAGDDYSVLVGFDGSGDGQRQRRRR